jgi:hypothetical protein
MQPIAWDLNMEMLKVRRRSPQVALSSSDKRREIALERIHTFRDVFSQLRDSQNMVVDGNPASQLPVFALEVLYAQNWVNGPIKLNFQNIESPTMAKNKSMITLCILLQYRGVSRQIVVTSEWTQEGNTIKAEAKCDGVRVRTDSFTAVEGKEKVKKASDSLQSSVVGSVTKVLDEIDITKQSKQKK